MTGSMKDLLGDTPYPESPGFARGSETSKAAAESMKSVAASVRADVLAFIKWRHEEGASSDEAEVALSLSHQTCSARFTELKAAGSIVVLPAVNRRKTRSGRKADVYVAKEFAP